MKQQEPLVRIDVWAATKISPAPHRARLAYWARNGLIQPQPSKIGRDWYVRADACFVAEQKPVMTTNGLTPEQFIRGEMPYVQILQLQEIRRLARAGRCAAGVYFLWLGDQLQYIGKSVSVSHRIEQHRRQVKIQFDSCNFLPLEPIEIGFTERAYIDRYAPPFNRQRFS